ncbi:MAG: hypothetical protein GX416_14530, partial [Bacteroidales bacterium]|nr:hypothetical protein [Bacteroidales bacterium]
MNTTMLIKYRYIRLVLFFFSLAPCLMTYAQDVPVNPTDYRFFDLSVNNPVTASLSWYPQIAQNNADSVIIITTTTDLRVSIVETNIVYNGEMYSLYLCSYPGNAQIWSDSEINSCSAPSDGSFTLSAGMYSLSLRPMSVMANDSPAVSSQNIIPGSRRASLTVTVSAVALPFPTDKTCNYRLTTVPVEKYCVVDRNNTLQSLRSEIQYYDDLGRESSLTEWKATPNLKNRITTREYDTYGRPYKEYLPYESGGQSLGTYDYSKTEYEASPLNRILTQYGPGGSWQANSKAVHTDYLTNVASGNTALQCALYYISGTSLYRSGYYADGMLAVTSSTDEDGHTVYEFKDRMGQIVLKRAMNGAVCTDTYFVYDDQGNIRVVLSPEASNALQSDTSWLLTDAILGKYAYIYTYDTLNRCIEAKMPDAETFYYRYDGGDHRIFAQDGEMRKRGKWFFSLPDQLGREVMTGTCGDISSLSYSDVNVTASYTTNGGLSGWGYSLSGITLPNPSVLKTEYYDDYRFLSLPAFSAYADSLSCGPTDFVLGTIPGLVTGFRTAQLGTSTLPDIFGSTYYDDRCRAVQTFQSNHLGGYDKNYKEYTFTGLVKSLTHRQQVSSLPTISEKYDYTYDGMERLTEVSHSLNGSLPQVLVSNTYDYRNRCIQRSLGRIKSIVYTYNVRNWLTGISCDKLTQDLYYTDGPGTALYNGNISSMTWRAGSDTSLRGYKFTYDGLERLTTAVYGEGTGITTNPDHYSENITGYTRNGAITGLQRYGKTTSGSYALIDNLTYTLSGNQLQKVTDAATETPANGGMHFVDGTNQTTEYFYDANGNMTQDLNKGITISYNDLNLPASLATTSGNITYLYAADGVKQRVVHGTAVTDYCGNFVYENRTLDKILTEEGYITMNGTIPTYHYYLQDHEGNNRVVINQSGTVEQVNHYYPFG